MKWHFDCFLNQKNNFAVLTTLLCDFLLNCDKKQRKFINSRGIQFVSIRLQLKILINFSMSKRWTVSTLLLSSFSVLNSLCVRSRIANVISSKLTQHNTHICSYMDEYALFVRTRTSLHWYTTCYRDDH